MTRPPRDNQFRLRHLLLQSSNAPQIPGTSADFRKLASIVCKRLADTHFGRKQGSVPLRYCCLEIRGRLQKDGTTPIIIRSVLDQNYSGVT